MSGGSSPPRGVQLSCLTKRDPLYVVVQEGAFSMSGVRQRSPQIVGTERTRHWFAYDSFLHLARNRERPEFFGLKARVRAKLKDFEKEFWLWEGADEFEAG